MILLMLTMLFSASWATTTITVQLRDSDGNTLPDGGNATLCYMYQSQWIHFANDGYGNFAVPVSVLPNNVRMYYNFGQENRFIDGLTNPVIFNTYTVTAQIQAPDNQSTLPGVYCHRGLSTYSETMATGTWVELLPGTHYIHLLFHTGQKGRLFQVTADNQIEYFYTTTILPRLIDCDGFLAQDPLDPAWHLSHSNVGPCGGCNFNEPHPALIGTKQWYRVRYDNQIVYESDTIIVPETPLELTFAVPCTFSFKSFPNTIGILVWHDADGDGTQTGEQNLGIAGVTVKLTKPNGTLLMTGVTNAQGIVTFENYPMNQPMKIRFMLPNGYEFTKSSGSIFNPMNSDASNNGNTNAFQGTGEFIGFVDCGLAYSSNKTAFNYTQDFNCYPNPASTLASLTYYLDEDALVNISAYNLAGQKVAIIDSGVKAAGQNTFDWDVTNLEPSVYFLRYEVSETIFTERFVITR